MKKCNKCGEVKPFEAFNKDARSKDRLHVYCKSCNAAYSAAYYAANKSKIRDKNAAYNDANRDKISEVRMDKYHADIEKSRATAARLRASAVERMSDGYIKSLLTNNTTFIAADIPDWLVEAKREQLRLKRELRK